LRFENPRWRRYFEVETHKHLMANNSVYKFLSCEFYYDYSNRCYECGLKPYSEPNWREIKDLFKNWVKNDELIEYEEIKHCGEPVEISHFLQEHNIK